MQGEAQRSQVREYERTTGLRIRLTLVRVFVHDELELLIGDEFSEMLYEVLELIGQIDMHVQETLNGAAWLCCYRFLVTVDHQDLDAAHDLLSAISSDRAEQIEEIIDIIASRHVALADWRERFAESVANSSGEIGRGEANKPQAESTLDAGRDRIRSLMDEAQNFWTHFGQTSDENALDLTIRTSQQVISLLPSVGQTTAGMYCLLASALLIRSNNSGPDLDGAISAARRALGTEELDFNLRLASTSVLVNGLQHRFDNCGDGNDIKEATTTALDLAQRAASTLGARQLLTLSKLLRRHYFAANDPKILEISVHMARKALDASSQIERSETQIHLAINLMHAYTRAGRPEHLNEAASTLHKACDERLRIHDNRAAWLYDGANALETLYNETGDPDDLRRAISMMRECVTISDRADKNSLHRWNDLGALLVASGDDESITAFCTAMRVGGREASELSRVAGNLGAALCSRFDRKSNPTDLSNSLSFLRAAVQVTQPFDGEYVVNLMFLATSLLRHYEHYGSRPSLDSSVESVRQAMNLLHRVEVDSQTTIKALGTAQIVLQARYDSLRSMSDLDEVIALGDELLNILPGNAVHRIEALINHATSLRERYSRTQDEADLSATLDLLTQARTTLDSGHPYFGHTSFEIARAYLLKFNKSGATDDLESALRYSEEAMQIVDPRSARFATNSMPVMLEALVETASTNGATQVQYLDRAVAFAETALSATPKHSFDRAGVLVNLAVVLDARSKMKGQREDLLRAMSSWKEAALLTSAPTDVRLTAARAWGNISAKNDQIHDALEAYSLGVSLLPLWASHSKVVTDRHWAISRHRSMAVNAAACAVQMSDTAEALVQLEMGRSVVWSQVLNLRSDLNELTSLDPELANRLNEVRTALDQDY